MDVGVVGVPVPGAGAGLAAERDAGLRGDAVEPDPDGAPVDPPVVGAWPTPALGGGEPMALPAVDAADGRDDGLVPG
jgi:hypothetical protein